MNILKLLLKVIVVFLLCFFTLSSCEQEKKESVYADPETQEKIYEMLSSNETFACFFTFEEYNFKVVKESISPEYTLDMFEFARTGVLDIKPSIFSDEFGTVTIYNAKLINENNEYAGSIRLTVEKDYISLSDISMSPIYEEVSGLKRDLHKASFSYADHADRIRTLLNSKEIIAAEDVKFVWISGVGEFFFVDYEGEIFAIPVGYTEPADMAEGTDLVIPMSELKKHADEQLARHEEAVEILNEMEKDGTNDFYLGFDTICAEEIKCSVSSVGNIINIYDYLGMEREEKRDLTVNTVALPWIMLAIMCVSAFVFVIIRQIILKKRSRSK